jgi:hypothetical protein
MHDMRLERMTYGIKIVERCRWCPYTKTIYVGVKR